MFKDSTEDFLQRNVLIQPNLTVIPAVGNMSETKLTIDNLEVLVPEGTMILEAARKAGSYIPALCYHPDLKPIGSCKLCIVSAEGREYYPTACNTLPEEAR
jgi:formate dehydrogenase (NADP+) alpha subunit